MTCPRVETISDSDGNVLALIARSTADVQGINFFTPDDFQQQVAAMRRPAGEVIPAHTHVPVERSLQGTQEVLVIQLGEMRVYLYSAARELVTVETVRGGDVVVLVSGGHGFEMVTNCHFIEVKQGPYVPGKDKTVFATNVITREGEGNG